MKSTMLMVFQGYLSSDCAEVRLAAVDCCAKMLTPFVRVFESFECFNKKQRSDVLNLIQSVLRQLVMVTVVDPCKFCFDVIVSKTFEELDALLTVDFHALKFE